MEEKEIFELLEKADWKDILLRLTKFAYWQAKRYSWRTKGINQLPGGKTPEDVVCEAIHKIWNGTRNWDPDKYPDLLIHLMWIVKSDIGHLCSSLEHKKTGQLVENGAEDNKEASFNGVCSDPQSEIHGHIPTPEEIIDIKAKEEREQKLKKMLFDIVKDDEDLEILFLCFDEGIYKPSDISKETGWDISKVYNLKRKLQRKAPKIKEVISQGD